MHRLLLEQSSYLPKVIPYPLVELLALHAEEVVPGVQDSTFESDGAGCVDVVSGDHAHRDASALALLNGIWHLRWKTTTRKRKELVGLTCSFHTLSDKKQLGHMHGRNHEIRLRKCSAQDHTRLDH